MSGLALSTVIGNSESLPTLRRRVRGRGDPLGEICRRLATFAGGVYRNAVFYAEVYKKVDTTRYSGYI